MRSRPLCCLLLLLALSVAHPVFAEWEVVLRDRTRAVELDRSTVLPSDPGTKVAWGRIVLTEEEAATSGYASVKALNRYDCKGRSFYTVKRVYLDADHNVLRDERVADPRPVPVEAGSVDERLWLEVCKPPPTMNLKELAEAAARAGAAATTPRAPVPTASTKVPATEPTTVHRADFHPSVAGERASLTPSKEVEPAPKLETPVREVVKPIVGLPAKTVAATPMAESVTAPPPAPKPVAEPTPKPTPMVVPRQEPKVAATSVVETSASPPKPKARPQEPQRLALAAKAAAPTRAVALHHDMHWSYEGEAGPDNWARINPEWSKCGSGERQSPIDIRDGIQVDMEPIRFDYRPSAFRVRDNGHTVQVIPADGNTLEVMGRRFELAQFHFHRPSEERVDGRAFDMVAHLVHRDQDGRLGVLAVLMEVGPTPNPVMQSVWNNLPLERGEDFAAPEAIDLAGLLPAELEYYAYMGSLTTPPCTEDVLWMVLRQPLRISEDQLRVFARLYPRNIRPIQPLHGRLIKQSR